METYDLLESNVSNVKVHGDSDHPTGVTNHNHVRSKRLIALLILVIFGITAIVIVLIIRNKAKQLAVAATITTAAIVGNGASPNIECPPEYTTITFDDIPNRRNTSGRIPKGYKHLTWTHFLYHNVTHYRSRKFGNTTGYATALVSGEYVASNELNYTMTVSSVSNTFNVGHFVVGCIFQNKIKLHLSGYFKSDLKFNMSTELNEQESRLIVLNWKHIDELEFTSSSVENRLSPYYAIDNMCIAFD